MPNRFGFSHKDKETELEKSVKIYFNKTLSFDRAKSLCHSKPICEVGLFHVDSITFSDSEQNKKCQLRNVCGMLRMLWLCCCCSKLCAGEAETQ